MDKDVIHPNMGFLRQLMDFEQSLFKVDTSSLSIDEWQNTIYERVEQLGFKTPHEESIMWKLETKAAQLYHEKYGRKNPCFTLDAGLCGEMPLHEVELYNQHDFVWLDELVHQYFPVITLIN